ncbi:hypothetical protein AAVH_32957, partial [Aphelenchoides avenae]
MRLEVSYAQLGFGAIEEEPAKSAWALFNDLAGNSGLWIGYTMLSFVEIVLITIQICLWTCGKELPEVPSLFRLNPWAETVEDSDSDEWDDDDDDAASASAARTRRSRSLSISRLPPKNFDNSILETALTRRMAQSQPELHDPQEAFEWIVPVLALADEHAVHAAN